MGTNPAFFSWRNRFPDLSSLCIDNRCVDLRSEFNYEPNEISYAQNVFLEHVDRNFGHLVDGTREPPRWWLAEQLPHGLNRWRSQLPTWARAVRSKVDQDLENIELDDYFGDVCMFIDGTFLNICRYVCMCAFSVFDVLRTFRFRRVGVDSKSSKQQ